MIIVNRIILSSIFQDIVQNNFKVLNNTFGIIKLKYNKKRIYKVKTHPKK